MNWLLKILIILAISFLITTCKKDSYMPEPETSTVPCLVTEITLSGTVNQTLEYDKYRRLIKTTVGNWVRTIEYGIHGKVSKVKSYFGGILKSAYTYTWENNTSTMLYSKLNNKKWETISQEIAEYDSLNRLVKTEFYGKNTDNWDKRGSHIYIWENWNLVRSGNFDASGIEKSYSTFEYNDKLNPYSSFCYPVIDFITFISKNNLTRYSFFKDRELQYSVTANCTYNGKDYPTKVVWKEEGETNETTYTYQYDCLE